MTLAPLRGGGKTGERAQLLERLHTEVAESCEQSVQDVSGRLRVSECTVARRHRRAEEPGQRGELAVGRLVAGEHPARQARRVDSVEAGPCQPELVAPGLDEPHVERRI